MGLSSKLRPNNITLFEQVNIDLVAGQNQISSILSKPHKIEVYNSSGDIIEISYRISGNLITINSLAALNNMLVNIHGEE